PEVLASTKADATTEQYAQALHDFLVSGLGIARGVIASRHFRSPAKTRWPRFRILPLTEKHRRLVVQRADLPGDQEERVIEALRETAGAFGGLAQNPMFVALICDLARRGEPIPASAHQAFENYVERRLAEDRLRIERRVGVTPELLREVAESAAYCMAAGASPGLSPTKAELIRGTKAVSSQPEQVESALSALEFIKIGQTTTD